MVVSFYHNYAYKEMVTYSPRTLPLVSTARKGIEDITQMLFWYVSKYV